MACFVAPMAEAIVITAVKIAVERKERKALSGEVELKSLAGAPTGSLKSHISWSRKLSWLNKMLWGGVLLLALEHLWHGEIVPWPPFFTAMNNPSQITPMLREIATVGVSMAVFVTAVWAVMVIFAERKVKNTAAVSEN